MKETLKIKIPFVISVIGIIICLYSIIGLLSLKVTDNNDYKCYLTTRGYICVFGGELNE